MADLISALLLGIITIPSAAGILILGRDEMVTNRRTTYGDGLWVIAAFFLIFVVFPVWAFLAS